MNSKKIYILFLIFYTSLIFAAPCRNLEELSNLVDTILPGKKIKFNVESGEKISGEIVEIYDLDGDKVICIRKTQGIIEYHFISQINPMSFDINTGVPRLKSVPKLAASEKKSLSSPDSIPLPQWAQNLSTKRSPDPKIKHLPDFPISGSLASYKNKEAKVLLLEPVESIEITGKKFMSSGDRSFISLPTKGDMRFPAKIRSIKKSIISRDGLVEIEVLNPVTKKIELRILDFDELDKVRVSSTSKRLFSSPDALAFQGSHSSKAIMEVKPIDRIEIAGNKFMSRGNGRYISIPDKGDSRLPAQILSIQQSNASGDVFIQIEVLNPKTNSLELRVLNIGELYNARVSSIAYRTFKNPQVQGMLRRNRSIAIFGTNPPSKNFVFSHIRNRTTIIGPGGKEFKILRDGKQYEIAKAEGRVFDNVRLEQLPKNHSYSYVITEGGDVSFGRVDDIWETGVKHANIAKGRNVLVAGELRVGASGKITFNLESGTYTKMIIDENISVTNESLINKVKSFFNNEGIEIEYTNDILFPQKNPSASRIKQLCRKKEFLFGGICVCPNIPVNLLPIKEEMCSS